MQGDENDRGGYDFRAIEMQKMRTDSDGSF
jgi:hypothetical protein